jgi:CHASE3 domain sensor protein
MMKQFVQRNFIPLAITVMASLIIISAGASYYNNQVMIQAIELRKQAEAVKYETQQILEIVKEMDISGRGYAIMKEDRFLYYSVELAKQSEKKTFAKIDSLLTVQAYSDPEAFKAVQEEMDIYIAMYGQMISYVQQDSLAAYKALLGEDRGDHFVAVFGKFSEKLLAYEDKLNHEAELAYEAAMLRNSIIQVLLALIGLPTLALVFYTLQKEAKARRALLLNLEKNNHQYLFNPGHAAQHLEEAQVLEQSIENLKKAADFINHISEGNYQVDWQELNEENKSLNQHNLVGKLVGMRDQMKKVKMEDEKRLWATEGLSQFSEVIRKHQHSLEELCYQSLVFLLKYLRAQQGSLFMHRAPDGEEAYLELAACYAFDRKKHLQKRIEIGQGILGQTYLEAETVMLTELPQQYTYITSGLGDATPNCLLIVPMKYNQKVQAIIELAAFRRYEAHEIAFIEKAGEFVASAITAAQSTETTQSLLAQFQLQTEQLRAQEEEMRQNMEELEATQEEMRRKEQVLEKRLEEIKKG